MIVRESETHLGARAATKASTRVASVGTDDVSVANDDNDCGAPAEVGDVLVLSSLHATSEDVTLTSPADLLLDLLEAIGTFRLEHDRVHLPEDFTERCLVVPRLERFEFAKLFTELLFDKDGHLFSSVAVKDAVDVDPTRQFLRNVSVLLRLAPSLHAGGTPSGSS